MGVERDASAAAIPLRVPLLTPAQVAGYLQVSEKTLANWRYLHRGPIFVRVGRDIRYREVDVDRWLIDVTNQLGA